MKKAFLDYFRCPEIYADFELRGDLCPGEGYFRFGPDLICYGQSSLGYYADKPAKVTCDLMYHLRRDGSTWLIPFDPSAIVENLRYERYIVSASHYKDEAGAGIGRRRVYRAYYRLRPYLGFSVRSHLKRVWLRGWKKLTFPKWPVDRTVDQIMERLLALSMKAHGVDKIPLIWFWPNGWKSCVILTHDVEESAGVNFCSSLMEIDDSFKFKSSFQLIPENCYSVPPVLFNRIRERGFEINVHDLNHDGHLYDDRQEFLRRARKINQYVKEYGASGFRAGALYRNLDWYDAFEFSYDMSVPNVGHLDPQPGGCCTLMPYFIGDVLELPLTTIQDYMLFNILGVYSTDLWKQQIEMITKSHGLASFNAHPDYLLERRAQNTYEALLAHLSELRAGGEVWIPLPKEVDRWWRERSWMKIVGEPGQWRIEGAGKERARLAYARLAGGRVYYTFEPEVANTKLSSEPTALRT
jgi:hypothetical protein